MNRLLIQAAETIANRRFVFFHLVGLDGITPANAEGGGQPQVATNLFPDFDASENASGIGTLNLIGHGRYFAELTESFVALPGTLVETRYKSGATAECPGDSVQIVAFDPYSWTGVSGAYLLRLNFTAASAPLIGVTVRVELGGESYGQTTGSDGSVVFSVGGGNYNVTAAKVGYTFTPVTLIVTANTEHDYVMTALVPAVSPDPTLATGNLTAYDGSNVATSGVVFQFLLRTGPGTTGKSYPRDPVSVTSGVAGVVAVGMLPGADYRGRRQTGTGWGPWFDIVVPNTPGQAFALPEMLGRLNG